MLVAEATANLACVGATAVAIVNCCNFGNPEHPEVMWQLSEAIDGMSEACRAFDLPVIGGNVSLYNESGGADIPPTPVIGGLGLVELLACRPPGVGWVDGATVVLLHPEGPPPPPVLGGSRWAAEVRGHRSGSLPSLDLVAHRVVVALVSDFVAEGVGGGSGLLSGVHDVSAGGLGVALAEMAVASGVGIRVEGVRDHAALFAEPPSRFVVATHRPDEVLDRARAAGVGATVLGIATGDELAIGALVDLPVARLRADWSAAIPDALGGRR
jgi:phosphoribosylformylglycinamidine synthase